jgi:hypothetical protein
MIAEMDLAALNRFRDIARNGARPGASSGERVANRLALALHRIGDDLALLDSSAIAGACLLIRAMSGPWPTDASKTAVFRTIRQAAGKA